MADSYPDKAQLIRCAHLPRIRTYLLVAIPILMLGLQVGGIQASYASSTSPSTTVAASKAASAAKKNVVTFGTQTSSATKPDGRGYYTFGSTPGGRILDHIAVINYSDQAVSLLIRPEDALNTPQDGFAARPINQSPRDIGTWIALPSADLTVNLAPRTDLLIPFLVEVPKNATPGDHFGVLTATLESSVISKSGQKLHLLQTVGTRVFLRVAGPLHPGFAIENLRVSYKGTLNPIGTGLAVVTYTVRNVGNVALGGRQTVSLTGFFGTKKVAKKVANIELLLPGSSLTESIPISGVIPEFRDRGQVSISALVIPGTVQSASGPYRASVSFWAIPWTLIAIVLAVILVAIGLLRRWRRRRSGPAVSPEKPSDPSGTVMAKPNPDTVSNTDLTGRAVAPANLGPAETEAEPAVVTQLDSSEVIRNDS